MALACSGWTGRPDRLARAEFQELQVILGGSWQHIGSRGLLYRLVGAPMEYAVQWSCHSAVHTRPCIIACSCRNMHIDLDTSPCQHERRAADKLLMAGLLLFW